MDAACTIQDSIHVFSLVRKYVSRILGTYHSPIGALLFLLFHIIFIYVDHDKKNRELYFYLEEVRKIERQN